MVRSEVVAFFAGMAPYTRQEMKAGVTLVGGQVV